jgi:hypothetical protein
LSHARVDIAGKPTAGYVVRMSHVQRVALRIASLWLAMLLLSSNRVLLDSFFAQFSPHDASSLSSWLLTGLWIAVLALTIANYLLVRVSPKAQEA